MPPRPPPTLLSSHPVRPLLFLLFTPCCPPPPRSSGSSSSSSRTTTRTIKSLRPPRPNRFNKGPYVPPLTSTAAAAFERKLPSLPLRTGLLAIKKGMSAMYDPGTGERTPCTVLQLDRVQVVAHKTRRQHGYFANQVGAGWKHPSNVTKPMLGHFAAQGVSPKRWLVEFRVRDEEGLVEVGKVLGPEWFVEGQFVDARAQAKGHGFTGGMKRHGWSGQPASHGASLVHRAMGSAGQSQGGGSRVYPGKKMAGRHGGQQKTVQNVLVMKVDRESGVVVLKGCISGPDGCVVKLQDAIKKPWPPLPKNTPPPPGIKLGKKGEIIEPSAPSAEAQA